LSDIGSGAGFPGIPIKLFAPQVYLTVIESQNKKATFLRELIRTLNLADAEVFHGRAEDWHRASDIVTLRAVESFADILPVAANLVAPDGKIGLLIGSAQITSAKAILGSSWRWAEPAPIPLSQQRTVIVVNRLHNLAETKQ
jgi:16S rRNA (guanine527-N7)-methyltransferase